MTEQSEQEAGGQLDFSRPLGEFLIARRTELTHPHPRRRGQPKSPGLRQYEMARRIPMYIDRYGQIERGVRSPDFNDLVRVGRACELGEELVNFVQAYGEFSGSYDSLKERIEAVPAVLIHRRRLPSR